MRMRAFFWGLPDVISAASLPKAFWKAVRPWERSVLVVATDGLAAGVACEKGLCRIAIQRESDGCLVAGTEVIRGRKAGEHAGAGSRPAAAVVRDVLVSV